MVQETEQFNRDIFSVQPIPPFSNDKQKNSKNTHNSLLKTQSSPLENILAPSIPSSRQVGPIRRPLQSTGNQFNNTFPKQQQQQLFSNNNNWLLNTKSENTSNNFPSFGNTNTTNNNNNQHVLNFTTSQNFNDYKLFEDTKNSNDFDSILANSLWSDAKTTSSSSSTSSGVSSGNNNQAWNSVLLNDCHLAETQNLGDSCNNRIKSLWSNSTSNNGNNSVNNSNVQKNKKI